MVVGITSMDPTDGLGSTGEDKDKDFLRCFYYLNKKLAV
jgi:hypothetical protein